MKSTRRNALSRLLVLFAVMLLATTAVFAMHATAAGEGASEQKLTFDRAKLNLNENIDLIVRVTATGYDQPYMVFQNAAGEATTVRSFTRDADGRLSFVYKGILPQQMGDGLTMTLYGDADHFVTYPEQYSVAVYCDNALRAYANDAATVSLISDLVHYGDAACRYVGETAASDHISATLSAEARANLKLIEACDIYAPSVLPSEGAKDANNRFESATISLQSRVLVTFRYKTDLPCGKVTLSIGAGENVRSVEQPITSATGEIALPVMASEFAKLIKAQITDGNGAPVGETMYYSVNTYLKNKQNDGNEALRALIKSLYRYGTSTTNYNGSLQSESEGAHTHRYVVSAQLDPKCNAGGYIKSICVLCSHEKTETRPAAHNFTAFGKCTECNAVKVNYNGIIKSNSRPYDTIVTVGQTDIDLPELTLGADVTFSGWYDALGNAVDQNATTFPVSKELFRHGTIDLYPNTLRSLSDTHHASPVLPTEPNESTNSTATYTKDANGSVTVVKNAPKDALWSYGFAAAESGALTVKMTLSIAEGADILPMGVRIRKDGSNSMTFANVGRDGTVSVSNETIGTLTTTPQTFTFVFRVVGDSPKTGGYAVDAYCGDELMATSVPCAISADAAEIKTFYMYFNGSDAGTLILNRVQIFDGVQPPVEHHWEIEKESPTARDCVRDANITLKCTDEGCTLKKTVKIKALGHVNVLTGKTIHPYCVQSDHYKCAICGVQTNVSCAIEHEWMANGACAICGVQGNQRYANIDENLQAALNAPLLHDGNMQSASGFVYLLLNEKQNPGIATERILAHLRNIIRGGNEPYFDLEPYFRYPLIAEGIALAKKTPSVWNCLTQNEIDRLDLIMKCFAVICALGTDDMNDFKTGPALQGNYGKNYNPNYRLANVTQIIFCRDYFGSTEATNQVLKDFDYDEYMAKFEEYGFTRVLARWTFTPPEDTSIHLTHPRDFMNGKKDAAGNWDDVEAFFGKRVDPSGRLSNEGGGRAGKGKGIVAVGERGYMYKGHTLDDPEGIIEELLSHCYTSDPVVSRYGEYVKGYIDQNGEYVEGYIDQYGSPYCAYIVGHKWNEETGKYDYFYDGEKNSVMEGKIGLMREFKSSDGGSGKPEDEAKIAGTTKTPRSSTSYNQHNFLMVVTMLESARALGIYDIKDEILKSNKDATTASDASLYSRIWVGNTDLIDKIRQGYVSFSLGKTHSPMYEGAMKDDHEYLIWMRTWEAIYGGYQNFQEHQIETPIVEFR